MSLAQDYAFSSLSDRPVTPQAPRTFQPNENGSVPAEAPEATATVGPEPLNDATAKDLVQLFKLLADETRLRILCFLLQEKELNVRTLCELLGQSQPAVSHHLALMRVAGLVDSRRDGKHNFYRILPDRVGELMEQLFQHTPGVDNSELRVQEHCVRYFTMGT
ncbi:ArsR/SmtB family transcription factor [Blastopirellula marina]|uniref:ArsR family transcriptional regulator n=1 Tax=Blastopirellula marina DSM 3645 TaxID=314230 RepID=A3ZYC6_9BACT|nr:metalloregulator ArsR/SmtB family transcription factor [Blastopirellula marina]EAQ78378.1 ArsR family transcriptional regulator [Blastopirellula marina DSM 3645]